MPDEILTLEKLKIHDRLLELEKSVAVLVTAHVTHNETEIKILKDLDDFVKLHYSEIHGNGDIGLKTKIDRLEQLEENRKWSFRALWSATIGMLIKIVFDLVGHRQ